MKNLTINQLGNIIAKINDLQEMLQPMGSFYDLPSGSIYNPPTPKGNDTDAKVLVLCIAGLKLRMERELKKRLKQG